MKKMFYSEELDKYFDDEKECRKAEVQYQLDKQAKEKAALEAKKQAELEEEKKKEELTAASKEKKELSDAFEKAETVLNEAQNEYRLACDKYKEEVRRIKKEYNEAIQKAEDDILKPAVETVKQRQRERYEALQNFNKKYGTYTVKYTGEKAYKEMQKAIDYMNDVFDRFWF